MPWYYLLYDEQGKPIIGGYSNSFEEMSTRVANIAEAGGLVSDVFEEADGYHMQFTKRKAIETINENGETVEIEF